MTDILTVAKVTDQTKCEVCDYEYDMVKYAESEKNPLLGPCRIHKTIIMCPSCLRKEIEAERQGKLESIAAYQEREKESLKTHLDIHNSQLISINNLKKIIDADVNVPAHDKNYALARAIDERFKHLNSLQKDLNEQLKAALEEQKSIQIFYNELAKKLRADEREKLTIRDVTYKPVIKEVKPKKIEAPKKYDKVSIRTAAQESGLPEAAVNLVCLTRNVSAVEAVRIIKGASEKAKESVTIK